VFIIYLNIKPRRSFAGIDDIVPLLMEVGVQLHDPSALLWGKNP
jgi:hypothetical protein